MHYALPGIDLATKMELKMLQINCRRCERVLDEVVQIMREKGCQIALLQEPYVGGDLPGDMRIFVNRTATAAILVDDADIQCIVYLGIEDYGLRSVSQVGRSLWCGVCSDTILQTERIY